MKRRQFFGLVTCALAVPPLLVRQKPQADLHQIATSQQLPARGVPVRGTYASGITPGCPKRTPMTVPPPISYRQTAVSKHTPSEVK